MISSLGKQWRRYLASGIAIALCSLFVTITLTVAAAIESVVTDSVTQDIGKPAVIVSEAAKQPESLQGVPVDWDKVAAVSSKIDGVKIVLPKQSGAVIINSTERNADKRNAVIVSTLQPASAYEGKVIDGKLPDVETVDPKLLARPNDDNGTSQSEPPLTPNAYPLPAVINSGLAKHFKLKVGDTIKPQIYRYINDREVTLPTNPLRVAAIVQGNQTTIHRIFATPKVIQALGVAPSSPQALLIYSNDNPAQLAERISSELAKNAGRNDANGKSTTLASKLEIQTTQKYIEEQTGAGSPQRALNYVILLAFPALSLLVGISVVSATFQIMLAGRTRELALLRCIGATAKQLRRSVLTEALILGFVSATLGVGAAYLLSIIGLNYIGMADNVRIALSLIGWIPPVAGLTLGVVMALLASARPARAATRVPPLAALSARNNEATTQRTNRLRIIITAVLVCISAPTIAFSIWMQAHTDNGDNQWFFLSFLASIMLFIAFVIFSALALTPLARQLLKPFTGRVTIELTCENLIRDSRRSATTATAVAVGVAVVTTMIVGAGTVGTSFNAYLMQKVPIDLIITSPDEGSGVDTATLEKLRSIPKLQAIAQADEVLGKVEPIKAEHPFEEHGILLEIDLHSVAHRPLSKTKINDGTIVLPESWKHNENWSEGANVTIGGKKRLMRVEFSVNAPKPMLSKNDFSAATASTPSSSIVKRSMLFAKFDKNISGKELIAAVDTMRGKKDTYNVWGGAIERGQLLRVIDYILMIVLALMAITMMIAVLGIANTLALSVAHRQHESALLRAIGMTKRQLRSSIVWEALTLGIVGSLAGSLAGFLFAWIGVHSLPIRDTITWIIAPDWTLLAGLIGAVMVASVLAAWIPSRMATRVSPVEALAKAN